MTADAALATYDVPLIDPRRWLARAAGDSTRSVATPTIEI